MTTQVTSRVTGQETAGQETTTHEAAVAAHVELDTRSARHAVEILQRKPPPWKRRLDLLGVLMVTPVLLPLLLLVACYIKLVSRGPVLFVQSRLGHGGNYFSIYKFRTMPVTMESRDDEHRQYVTSTALSDGPIAKPDFSGNLIPGGSLLRKTSIDELPQLLNVWLGNMSLVGPRPDVLQREDYVPQQLRRFEVLPGMTGLWQVSGKNELSFDQMIELDIEYIETMSLKQDVSILARTVKVLLFESNE